MSLEPAKHTFKVWRGTTFRRVLDVFHDEAETDPYNFAGYSGDLTIRDKKGGTTLGNVGVTFSGGQVTLLATAVTTAGWSWSQGVYELMITSPGGDVDMLLYGLIQVKDVS